ncbi:MAG: sigma-70 family RNA polymerase sigma factor [Candidatus Poribacteria bacterium]|nr:sigma-70 family RNA polymerase sigma factor [Candidatus Poribacteria bacterium]
MVENDVQLIRRILSGDDAAFSVLVQKYQKNVHALVWRKIGDFHIAEEITQDTFLRVYKSLATLKNPNLFAGWLYVIANRLCINWSQKNGPAMQSLENTPMEEIERSSYAHYLSEQREVKAADHHGETVQKLLQKLPESERTVVTLYYLGEMTAKEIGNFLGVSVNTIKSRIRRAKKRLQNEEELLISKTLGSVQLPVNLTERIMQEVANIKQTSAPVAKPLLPWAAFGAAAVLVILLLGVSNQYLARFQKPYSFEAQSEPTIEIVDAPMTLEIDAKPAVRNQAGRAFIPNENEGNGLQTSETVSPTDTLEISPKFSTSQWTQADGPQGGTALDIFATPEKTLYAVTPSGIYRSTADETAWTLTDTSVPIGASRMPMAASEETLYIVSADAVFTSTDAGGTWNVLCPRPKGHAIGLIIVDETQGHSSQTHLAMYLALKNKGVFRSTDAGAQWTLLNDGLTDKSVSAVAAIGNTVFAGTSSGLYRLTSEAWEQLSVAASEVIHSLVAHENNLYIVTGHDLFTFGLLESRLKDAGQIVRGYNASSSRIFYSTDLGASWTEITPKNKSPFVRTPMGMQLIVAGETLLLLGVAELRSTDGGQTWTDLGFDRNLFTLGNFSTVAIDEHTFYNVSASGVYRTTDGGESWQPFMNGMAGTRMQDLVAFNDRLYMHTGSDVFQSTDVGTSWKNVPINSGGVTLQSVKAKQPQSNFSLDSRLIVADNTLYGIIPDEDDLRVFHLSLNSDMFVPVHRIPSFARRSSAFNVFTGKGLAFEVWTSVEEVEPVHSSDGHQENDSVPVTLYFKKKHWGAGGFAVSGETFYMECQRRLFRWEPGSTEWKNTGLIDTTEQLDNTSDNGFKLAASAKTVYVGKRDGKLFQSLDAGDSWKNITSSLPLHFTRFNEIVFVGATVYVATDMGVLSSQNGEHWRTITDKMGACPIIDRFAVDDTTVYGAADTGIYRLEGEWQQISPEAPGKVVSLIVSNDRLYIATEQRGLFHISLETEAWVGVMK